jgi:hypothetical protein
MVKHKPSTLKRNLTTRSAKASVPTLPISPVFGFTVFHGFSASQHLNTLFFK